MLASPSSLSLGLESKLSGACSGVSSFLDWRRLRARRAWQSTFVFLFEIAFGFLFRASGEFEQVRSPLGLA
jgi:hypothetical protein